MGGRVPPLKFSVPRSRFKRPPIEIYRPSHQTKASWTLDEKVAGDSYKSEIPAKVSSNFRRTPSAWSSPKFGGKMLKLEIPAEDSTRLWRRPFFCFHQPDKLCLAKAAKAPPCNILHFKYRQCNQNLLCTNNAKKLWILNWTPPRFREIDAPEFLNLF